MHSICYRNISFYLMILYSTVAFDVLHIIWVIAAFLGKLLVARFEQLLYAISLLYDWLCVDIMRFQIYTKVNI